MVDTDATRTAGSGVTFDDDWQRVLATDDQRYLVYPDAHSGRQVDLLEWIKARQIQQILHRFNVRSGDVLEYGCGAAGMSLFLAQQGYRCHLCDLSRHALHVAERNRQQHAPQAQLESAVVGDGLLLPYAANSFDVVMSYGLLEHFAPQPLDRLLAETTRVLKPGGVFLADIVPGPEQFNMRTISLFINATGSAGAHLLRGQWQQVPHVFHAYFEHFYENTHDAASWQRILSSHSLSRVQVDVCRPFPLLALSGPIEQQYTALLRAALPLHQRFDGANNWLTRRWGWMYLAYGRKPCQP